MSRILIVEDEKKIARFLELELTHEGYEVQTAGDGRSGLEQAQSWQPDLLILDLMLPELSGIEVPPPAPRQRRADYYADRERRRVRQGDGTGHGCG